MYSFMKHYWVIFSLFVALLASAGASPGERTITAGKFACKVEIEPEPHAISPNIVFVVDASSSINRSKEVSAKFDLAWGAVTAQLGQDQIYACAYTFHDLDKDKFLTWEEVNDPQQFTTIQQWIRNNTGIYSWGQKVLQDAIKQTNPLIRNPHESRRLTVILITDGGFTEAARAGSYDPIYESVEAAQQWRTNRGLEPATIVAVGLENTDTWSISVKRPDFECQEFLKRLGQENRGGYFHVVKRVRRVS